MKNFGAIEDILCEGRFGARHLGIVNFKGITLMINPPIKSANAAKADKPHVAPSTQPEANPMPAKPADVTAPKATEVKK